MYRLTIPQQNIWNLQRYYENTSISNNCGAVFYDRKCDHRHLCLALNKLIELQDGMRLRFAEKGGIPMQYVAEYAQEEFPSMYFDSMDQVDAYAAEFAKKPFSLTGGAMYRFVPFDVADRSGVLMCASHLISDAWAISIISRTVSEWKDAFEQGVKLEEKQRSFLPFLDTEKAYLSSARYEKDKAYWAERYPARPEPSSIRPGSAPAGATARRYSTVLSPERSAAIDSFYTQHNISQAVLFEAAIIAYLSRINPENHQISLGILTLNRSGAAEKRTVGNCISTLPLTVDLTGTDTVEELCRAISAGHFQMFRHQKFPYSHILHGLHERYGFSGNLYDVMVSFQNAKTGTADKTKWYSNGFCEVPLEFHIDNRDGNDFYTLNIDYQTELFQTVEEVQLLVRRILFILEQMIEYPTRKLSELSILPQDELQKVLYAFNDTAVDIPRNVCIQDLFAQQVAQLPDKTALIFENKRFTYRQLDEMSNSLAHYLQDKGVGPGAIVPIVSRRSWHIIAAMLGVLKAGGAYMHVDTAYPPERIAYMFETARCHFALTYGYAHPLGVETAALEHFDFTQNVQPVGLRNDPEDLCYVIFTSGSTGKPKGLMIAHRNAINFAHRNSLNVVGKIIPDNSRSILAISSTSFDMSVTETLLPLMDGITIYFANDEQILSQTKLREVFHQGPVHIMETTPTKMRLFMANRKNVDYLQSVEAFILGGEELPSDLYRELREITSAKIFNNYGPAETTVWSTIKQMVDDVITIGRPIANTQVYILDQQQRGVPIGVAGELYISGDGIGKGYLNRPDLTAERFLPDPFRPGQIMYRTGDLARWRTDGEIEYLGRIDTQVKIRGLRIELGEIESVMSSFDGVGLAAVTDKRDENGRQYLVGYYTAETPVDETALRRHLTSKLPQYMVPNFLIHLPSMPMTPSGKTDRKNLPTPELTLMQNEYVAPETASETILCGILSDLLSAERIGVTDDFFELGGDSLCAIEYVAQAHNQGIEIALQNVFDYPTVRGLCEYLGGAYIRKTMYDPADFVKYEPLLKCNSIDESFVPVHRSLGNVFLTGATGFLGAHILDQYLREETGTIYCLVRGGAERLLGLLDYYFDGKYNSDMDRRIIVLDGDITEADLCDRLPDDIQTVIHAAATVKHYGPWDYFHSVNVRGTENIIACAKKLNAKLLHISTISVSGNSLVDAFDVLRVEESIDFTESDLFVGQPLDNVYIRSKFEAERAVLDAALDGLDAKIIRVGNLTNRLTDFRFQPNYHSNAFLNRIRAALALGALPDYMVPLYAEFSPIDQTAEGVLKIGQYADRQTVFHLNSHRNLYFDRMVELLNQLDAPMQILPGEAFNAMLQQMGRDPETAFIYEALQNDMDDTGKLVYDSNIHIRNGFTVWFLEKLGFCWAEIDFEYISGYIQYFRNLGYFS